MPLLLLSVSLLIVLGLLMLPPLTGDGTGTLFARSWLAFALLVFWAHYHRYLEYLDKKKEIQPGATAPSHRRRPVRSAEYK